MSTKPTDASVFLEDLDGGVFHERLCHTLSEVAAGVVAHNKQGKVRITLDMKRLGNGAQVLVSHTLEKSMPTKDGKQVEDYTRSTPVYVHAGGQLSLFNDINKDMQNGQRSIFAKGKSEEQEDTPVE